MVRKAAFLFSLLAIATPAAARELTYTYDVSPDDALFRDLAEATFARFKREPGVISADCRIMPANFNKKSEGKFRKRHGLPPDTTLYVADCEVQTAEMCERSALKGTMKCYEGDAEFYVEKLDVADSGDRATAKTMLAFSGPKGRQSKRIVNIFYYHFPLTKSASGWEAGPREFRIMGDL